MKLRRRFDNRAIFVAVYIMLFVLYIIIGLQPADAANYEVSSKLTIPSIGLNVDVTALSLESNRLETPDTIVGSYSRYKNKTLLIGHSSTVFQNLDDIIIGDSFEYNNKHYIVVKARLVVKEAIDMDEILVDTDKDTVVIMTCAGEDLGGGDATHRLIIYAEAE